MLGRMGSRITHTRVLLENEHKDKLVHHVPYALRHKHASNDRIPGGKGHLLDPRDVDPIELKMGIRHEMEHTIDPDIAKEIALDHLAENPKYYSDMKRHDQEDAEKEMTGPVDDTGTSVAGGDQVIDPDDIGKTKKVLKISFDGMPGGLTPDDSGDGSCSPCSGSDSALPELSRSPLRVTKIVMLKPGNVSPFGGLSLG